jgi:peptide/nickel transport system substrate-binding protein
MIPAQIPFNMTSCQKRGFPPFRDPAVILIDQLKDVFIEGELEIVETALWYPKMYRKDYKIGLNLTGGGVDDPDQQFYENYACGSPRNYTDYCNPELEKLFDRQSAQSDEDKRKRLVWEIERKLAEDGARPIFSLRQHRIGPKHQLPLRTICRSDRLAKAHR